MVAVQRVLSALRRGEDRAPAPPATWRDDLVAGLLAGWMALGLFVDGWAHINLRQGRLGPFFTPWHGMLYAGFTAAAVWILTRGQNGLREWNLNRVPRGYGLALVGMVLTGVAVAGDAAWHTIFGEEADVARLLAPFHLFLFLGAAMLCSSPLRSAWSADDRDDAPTSREFVPALLSLVLTTGLAVFFVQFVSPYVTWFQPSVLRLAEASPFHEAVRILDVSAIQIWSLLLIAPLMLVLRRWKPPAGTATLLFTTVVALMSALNEFTKGGLILGAFVGGLITDIAIAKLRPWGERAYHVRTIGAVAPAALWGAHFIAMRVFYGVTWPPEIWGGALGLAGIAGYTLGLLMIPPNVPGLRAAAGTASDAVPVLRRAQATAMAEIPAERFTPTPTLLGFVQELADLVERAEVAVEYGEAAAHAREAARILRAAAEKLPGHVKPAFPLEDELAKLEALAHTAGPPTVDYLEAVRDAAGIIAGTRRGLPLSDPLRLVLLNLTARAERTLLPVPGSAIELARAIDDEASRRQRTVVAGLLADDARLDAMVASTARRLASVDGHDHAVTANGHVLDLTDQDERDLTERLIENA